MAAGGSAEGAALLEETVAELRLRFRLYAVVFGEAEALCWADLQALLAGAPGAHRIAFHFEFPPQARLDPALAQIVLAAAMLGASLHYPLRGAVTWKSIVGTNVAADALSNLSSPGVMGGTLIVVGEDYGEGASVIQERTHAYALKSGMCLLDPRPDLPRLVEMVEQGFGLSEASNMPVLLELRIRACHVRGSFPTKDNRAPAISTRALMSDPARFDYMRLAHPPVTFRQEKLKVEQRIPAARRYIVEQGLNELMPGRHEELGLGKQSLLTV
jgi:indolepyruvate ferredoxin oxidoreductase alpha subunit